MEISPIRLSMLLFCAFIFGMIIGFGYDVVRGIRTLCGEDPRTVLTKRIREIKLPILKRPIRQCDHKIAVYIVMFLGDVLCIMLLSIGTVILNYGYNQGEFRAFTIIGAVGGFFLYRWTIGRLVMSILEPAVALIKFLIFSLFIIFGYPGYKIFAYIIKNVGKMNFLYNFTLEKKNKKVYNVAGVVSLPDEKQKTGRYSFGKRSRKKK